MNNRIKQIRKEMHMTQQAFADALNISKSTVEGYEYGRLNVTDRVIADLCRLYNINEDWLRTGEGEMHKPKDRNSEIADIVAKMYKGTDEVRMQWTQLLWEMSPEEIEFIKDMIKKMAAAIDKNEDRPI